MQQDAEALIFDGDDTLWHVEFLYDEARSECRAIVEGEGIDGAAWENLERRIDVGNVASFGMSRRRFPASCVEAYRLMVHEAGSSPLGALEQRLEQVAGSVFRRQAALDPSAEAVLRELATTHRLALLTKGDEDVQLKRIADSGLASMFERAEIVAAKTSSEFSGLLRGLGVSADHAWSIGNSLPSDINPALSLGMAAIWIDAHVWEHERRETEVLSGRLFEVPTLLGVPSIIAAHHRVA